METIILILILSCAFLYIIYRLYRLFFGKMEENNKKGCIGCDAECPLRESVKKNKEKKK